MKRVMYACMLAVSILYGENEMIRQSGTYNLIWQDDRSVVSEKMDFQGAIDYCNNLTLGGYDDWRLPLVEELFLIADRKSATQAIDSVFKNHLTNRYWANSANTQEGVNAWYVSFEKGEVASYPKELTNYVRCVRLDRIEPNFLRDDAREIVTETNSQLIWQDNEDVATNARVYSEALSYCTNLTHAGYSDWRLPSIEELYLIGVREGENVKVNGAFVHFSTTAHWSATESSSSENSSWVTYFNSGLTDESNNPNPFFTRCVRGTAIDVKFTSENPIVTIAGGWSQISAHINGKKYLSSLYKKEPVKMIVSYDATKQIYVEPEYIEPNTGYWINSAAQTTVRLQESAMADSATMSIASMYEQLTPNAWNLAGTSVKTTLTELKALKIDSIWRYNGTTNSWNDSETIPSGAGFWIKTVDINKKTSPKWETPLQSECEARNGQFNISSDKQCNVSWESAQAICAEKGKTLPSKAELEQIVTQCGGKIGDFTANLANSEYQSCYQKLGFSKNNPYWSVTEDESGIFDAYYLYFGDGTVGLEIKGLNKFVRCIER